LYQFASSSIRYVRRVPERAEIALIAADGSKDPISGSYQRILLGDIGATNARFAVLVDNEFGPVCSMQVADYERFADAISAFLHEHCPENGITSAAFAVAGPVVDARCKLTNCPWMIDACELCAEFELPKVDLVNDFEATALSLPHLTAADLYALGGARAVPDAPMAVLGPGSGLGVACLVPRLPMPL